MEIGTEISQKIRSAIKAKLVELGAYVDDELPDYIMVMVANKKTKKQMSDDLSLFLVHNTDKFTTWLHSLLNKLQTLSTDQQKSNEIENESKRSSEPKKKQSPSQKVQSESKVTSKERSSSSLKRKSSDKGSSHRSEEKRKTVTSGSEKSSKSNLSEIKSNSERIKDTKKSTEEEYEPELIVKAETDEFSEEFKEKEEKNKGTSRNTDSKSQKATSHVHPTSKVRTSSSSSSSVQVSVSVKTSSSSSSSVKRTSRTVNSGSERTVERVPAGKVIPEKRKKPLSVVASSNIVKRYAEEVEEEYDPYNPAVGRVASVVKVDRRSAIPPSLQANKLLVMKAVNEAEKSCAKKTPSILQQEKMYSEKERALIRPIQRVEQPDYSSYKGRVQREVGGLELISKSRRQELLRNMTYTIDNYTKKTLPERLGEKRRTEPEVARVPPVMDSRFVQCSNDVEEDEDLQEVEEEIIQESASEQEVDEEVQSVPEEVDEINSRSTEDREELQLEEADNVNQEEVVEEQEVEEIQEEEEQQDQTDPEIQQVLEDVDNDLDLGDEQESVHPKAHTEQVQSKRTESKKTVKERPKSKEIAQKAVNTKFIVTLDGVEPEVYEKREVEALQVDELPEQFEEHEEEYIEEYSAVGYTQPTSLQAKVAPPKIKPISINLKDTDDENEEEDEEEQDDQEDSDETPLKKAKMMERCKFWPACINGSSCPYHHPTTTCKTFPNCKFGDKCLYIHSNCKFDSKCTRKDCPFTHASRRGSLTTVIQQIVPVPIQAQTMAQVQTWPNSSVQMPPFAKQGTQLTCKFFPNCRNMSCPFIHPKPCRYGLACMNKQTCTFHHPSVPTKDKMTWTAQKSQHISQRKFDAGAAKSVPTSIT